MDSYSETASYNKTRKITWAERKTIVFCGIIVLLVGGGIGVYLPLLLDRPVNAESFATYALAVLAPVATDILLPEKYWRDISKQARMGIGALFAFAAALSFAALVRNEKPGDLTCAVISVVVVLFTYYHVAVLSGKFQPEIAPSMEDGGPTSKIDKPIGAGLPS
ncbi:hypothetical protein C8R31_101152 [Nitrosospira sp. Nsp2]|uniref:hypothetical protein n=1 Tax=Nitrosospira sp. Nsp2 TaxID=136548 RepID=UPI000D2FDA5E|nr:hypothetical protein [Nitrosospira sp. Nsp2]PTR16997.1 hypothetical protein C8R31_101152 [Nitrosospira sp. Nsp2]